VSSGTLSSSHDSGFTCSRLQNGNVFIAGGTSSFAANWEIRDVSGALIPGGTGTLWASRQGHKAAVQSDTGNILITGGLLSSGTWELRASNGAYVNNGSLSAIHTTGHSLTELAADLIAPVLSNGQPTGTLLAGTTQTTLSVATNENATCRYSTTPGVAYSAMTNTFSTTGTTAHSTLITGLVSGQNYSFYLRCQDPAGNANTTDFVVSFSIGNPRVSAKAGHTCAVLSNGTVKCWGINSYGQLGNGTTTSSSIPVPVSGITTARAVTTGQLHSCAILSNGTVQCWGYNAIGQLGNGTTTNSLTPVAVSGITTATAVTSGTYFTCAQLLDGTVRCWGQNISGQLGNGTTTNSSSPVIVSGITTATTVASGDGHTCARLSNGAVQCWGNNAAGQLGNGTTTSSLTPVTVSGITTATDVAGGEYAHSCARLSDGTVMCWGNNLFGQLGNGLTTNSSTPVTVSGITTATDVTAGLYRTCAPLTDESVKCWGVNSYGYGLLGNGDPPPGYSSTPVTVSGIP
jgi:WD40 repeat protein